MKRTEEILGLSIISISDGREVGMVRDVVVNPEQGAIECLVVENGNRYLGVRVISFEDVEGVGEYAVTIASEDCIVDLKELQAVSDLLERNVLVKGTKVLTNKGKLIGEVSEYIVDEDNNGKIIGCQLVNKDGDGTDRYIPKDSVITFGKDVLVVVANVEETLTTTIEVASAGQLVVSPQQTEVEPEPVPTEEAQEIEKTEAEVPDAAKLFEQRQRQYMVGRKVAKQILDPDGQVLAEDGDIITEELIEKIKSAGKWAELTMNNRS